MGPPKKRILSILINKSFVILTPQIRMATYRSHCGPWPQTFQFIIPTGHICLKFSQQWPDEKNFDPFVSLQITPPLTDSPPSFSTFWKRYRYPLRFEFSLGEAIYLAFICIQASRQKSFSEKIQWLMRGQREISQITGIKAHVASQCEKKYVNVAHE